MKKCIPCKKTTGIIRIILGAIMLYFGVSKLGADPEMIAYVGGAGHQVGLTFLSVTTWFWIATLGEILAGILLIFGFMSKLGALLATVIMLFALNSTGWNFDNQMTVMAGVVGLGALYILWQGSGNWALQPEEGTCCSNKKHSCCQEKITDTPKEGCCGGGCCHEDAGEEVSNNGEK